MNRQACKEMHLNLIRYHVYQKLKAYGYKVNLHMTMYQFADKQNIVYDSLKMENELFSFLFGVTNLVCISPALIVVIMI